MFRLLGPVEALVGGSAIAFARPQHRDLLALLLLHPNKVLTRDQIIEGMWGAAAPSTATAQVQNMISALRSGVGCGIRGIHAGYELEVDEGRIDLSVFGRILTQAGAATDPQETVELLRVAIGLWHGHPLAGVRAPYAAGARTALAERRLLATETLYDAELKLGRHSEIVPELTGVVAGNPLRERLVGQLMTALYRCGRQAEALDAYRELRSRLIDEHGLDPSPALRDLERLVLNSDPVLNRPTPAAEQQQPPALTHRAPPAPANLVGRQAELIRLTEQAAVSGDGTRVAVYGAPGVGKTALALTAAERLQDRCPDGQLFVDLGGSAGSTTSRELLALLIRGVGARGSTLPDTEAERVMMLRSLVGGTRLLLLLDDVAAEAQIRPALSARWSAVILTSRVRLAALEDVEHLPLGVLNEPDAVRLLANTAPEQVGADPLGAAQIAASCGGLPLAVRLAGAKLASRPHWTAGRMATRLADERRRLDELQVGDHAVRASFELSHTTLDPSRQRVFRTLGYLGGTNIDPWLAAAALGMAEAEVADLLEDLVTAQLLDVTRPPAPEYRLHDLLRVFARERFDSLEPPGEAAEVAKRVAESLLPVAQHVEQALCTQGVHPCGRQPEESIPREVLPDKTRLPQDADLIGWLAGRRVVAQAAVSAAHAEGLWAHCWALGRALIPLLEVGGHYDDWWQVSHIARDAARRAGQSAWAAAIDAGLGTLHHYRGEWDQSRAALNRAITVWNQSGDTLSVSYATLVLAMTIRAAGGADTQLLLHSALDTAAREHDPVLAVEALRCLAWVDRDLGRADAAVTRLEDALRQVGDVSDGEHRLRGYVLHDLGVMRAGRLEQEEASHSLHAALKIFEQAGDRHWTGLTLFRLGETCHATGRLAEAVTHLQRAHGVFRELHDRLWEATVLLRLGDTHRDLGHHRQAEELLTISARLYQQLGQRMQHAHVQVSLGELREAQHNLEAALAAFAEAWQHLGGTRPSQWRERAKAGLDRVRSMLPHELGV